MIDLERITNKTLSMERIKVNDVIANYPEGVTISGVVPYIYKDKATKERVDGYGFTFEENADVFFPATAGDLRKLVNEWLTGGDIDEVNEYLSKKHLKVRIEKITQKSGDPYTKVYRLGWKKVVVETETVPAPAEHVDENGLTVDSDTGEVVYGNGGDAPF